MPPKALTTNTLRNDLEPVLERAGAKERAKIEKHLAALETEGAVSHAQLWRRVAATLGSLAPVALQSVGNNAWRFFVPDGKYKMQVFALEDPRDGTLLIYLPDVLNDATKKKIVSPTAEENVYKAGSSRHTIRIDSLDANNTPNPAAHIKAMLGWNRKALRVTMPASETDPAQVSAVASILSLAAEQWVGAATEEPA